MVPIPDNEDNALLETNLSKIDQMEQEYLHEYYLIKEKDKAAGKDFNKVAHDEMVRAQFDFDQMRKFERQKHQEILHQKMAKKSSVTVAPIPPN